MSRRRLIVANWKMNAIPEGALAHDSPYQTQSEADVWVLPTFLDLQACIDAKLFTGAQCGHHEAKGAHTGAISMAMLAKLGCRAVLCGHSERRRQCQETDEMVVEQVIAALEAGLHPIVCIGEEAHERESGHEKKVVQKQLDMLPTESDLTISYEPVWAIGTGVTAKPDQVQKMHAFIRSLLPADRAAKTRILYGGSVGPEHADELLAEPDVDGCLVGAASLDPASFARIVEIAVETAE